MNVADSARELVPLLFPDIKAALGLDSTRVLKCYISEQNNSVFQISIQQVLSDAEQNNRDFCMRNPYQIGSFYMSGFNGCCGVAMLYNTHIDFRAGKKGIGTMITEIAEDIAIRAGYGCLIGTTIRCSQAVQNNILRKLNWEKVDNPFINPRTGNEVTFWKKELCGKWGEQLQKRDGEWVRPYIPKYVSRTALKVEDKKPVSKAMSEKNIAFVLATSEGYTPVFNQVVMQADPASAPEESVRALLEKKAALEKLNRGILQRASGYRATVTKRIRPRFNPY